MRYRYLLPPIGLPFFFLLFLMFVVFFTIFSGIVTAAFQKLGIPPAVAYTLFLASLFGSFVNIPVAEERTYVPVVKVREVRFFGIPYPVPYFDLEEQKMIIAINVGGALVPLSIVLYEVLRLASIGRVDVLINMGIAVGIASLFSYAVSKPVRGVGVAIPSFVPPIIAVILALLFGGDHKPIIAYASGTLGVLIGADLMNWGKLKYLGAPMVSIGGAGTFDGIFLAGIIAVLLV
ncbi:DUF1614 domain-containing protein [Thermococcus gammatolerans]|uniref:DUF1614 domain-containing protein n=1 Tax=Thermococcus gammatolerans (strain DSM 15229 / JCM 11827 / EJ3) TaxID=593117 RepID=C5A2D3_THEGJ|nr:DUF1614 domain-containing protein [Thermococcus gammatolerans]ACS34552.1 Conserved hypothetical protein [Thermococcus gammatolerans EJ3]